VEFKNEPGWPYNVAHYSVRSGDDPAYRKLESGTISHPQSFTIGQKVMVGENPAVIVGKGDGPGYWRVQFNDGLGDTYYQTNIKPAPTQPGQSGTFSRVLSRMGLRGPLAYHAPAKIPQRAGSDPLMGIPAEYRQAIGKSKALEAHDRKVMAALSRAKE
jgi:hypothetical protein